MNEVKSKDQTSINYISEVFEAQKEKALAQRIEPLSARKLRLKKLSNWILNNRETIKHAVHSDFRKPKTEVDVSEIFPLMAEIKHASSHLDQWAKPKKVDAPLTYLGSSSHIQYEPKGVSLILSPWNYPFSLAIGPLVSALAAGCTAMLKPSELTPNTSALIEKMVGELYPENEVCVFQGAVETAQELLKLPFDHIFFTGSPAVGKIVMGEAAKNLSSVTLELGGKSPVIIDKTANLKDAAEKVAWGKFLNCGQTCLAPDYLLVHKDNKEAFIDHFKAFVQLQFDKDLQGYHNSPDYARIVNDKHYNRINGLIKEAIDKGAKIEIGGQPDEQENFIPPTVLSNVASDAKLMEEEIFGPVLPVITYSSLDEAITMINQKPKPLALYFFGRSRKNRKQVLAQTSSGGACVNDCVVQFSHHNLPFGGVNNSGIGKSHGYHGFLAFSNEKGVLKQRIGLTASKSIYPPYTATVRRLIDAMIKYF